MKKTVAISAIKAVFLLLRMRRISQLTADGSSTIAIPDMNVTYHSTHGAIQESMHVFIHAGLDAIPRNDDPIRIFEMGLGTGLNALLTWIQADSHSRSINYTALEKFPLEPDEYSSLNYCNFLPATDCAEKFVALHGCGWETPQHLSPRFTFTKHRADLEDFEPGQQVHLVYYDAFAPAAQPELWTAGVFEKLFTLLLPGGLLVTYCSKGDVRRAMQSAGFVIEKIPGPPGKREMVRAWKK